jgi:hypothetical protein
MEQPSQNSWWTSWLPLWITALVPLFAGVGVMVKRFFNTVTREELKQAILESELATQQRHAEHLKRYDRQEDKLDELGKSFARLEGELRSRKAL